MTLTLSVLRGPDQAPLTTREISGGKFSIGRAPDNDWVLADRERHLSKRHCVIALRDGLWQVADLSTNGTYLNREAEAIGPGQRRDLRDGDLLRLGAYEVAVRIAEPYADPFATPTSGLEDSLFAPLPAEPSFNGPVQPDHSPGIEDAFRPPRPVALLADDWDLDPAPATPAPSPAEMPQPVSVAALPAAPVSRDVAAVDLFAAFLQGAGLQAGHPADPVAAMTALGTAFRAMISGLRALLMARAAAKGEFRITQTMIRARGNNPLKFSASDDDALAGLLGLGRPIEMEASAAVAEALSDMRLHELATMAAMQSAVRALLRELSPTKIRDRATQGALNLLAAQRKTPAWDAFEAEHARITTALADDFDSVFGRAFARAYEQALVEAGESAELRENRG